MPPMTPPERPNLATLLDTMTERWKHETAVAEHRGVRLYTTSYTELAWLARRFAAELDRRGIGKGERVVLCGANSAPWIAAFYGCVLRGVLPVPLDAAGTGGFALRVTREVSPRLIVSNDPAPEAPAENADAGAAAALLEASRTLAVPRLALRTLAAALPREESGALEGLSAEDGLQILFTSGTTGEPKGIVHTHGNLLASITPIEREIEKYRRYERWVHPLRFLHTLPLSHVFGQFMGLWVPPLLGAAVHYESRTSAARLLDLIAAEKINVLAAVPRTLELLRTHLLAQYPGLAAQLAAAAGEPPQRRWWRFRRLHRQLGLRFWAAVCGGATLPADLESFWTTLGFALIQGYGLTETSALVTLNHPFRTARGSLGAPLPGRTLRVSDSGELEVQGDMVSRATWQNGQMVTREEPWLATGDLAEVGEDGRVRLLGRTGQRLVTPAGLNVYLRDVEEALAATPGIDDALVFAWHTAEGMDEPAAVLVMRNGSAAANQAVLQANAALAPHQRVRRWLLWPELAFPRTATSKLKRAAVEQWAREALGNPASAIRGDHETGTERDADEPLLGLLRSVAHLPPGAQERRDDAARLEEDWGLDSMARVSLASALEDQIGVALDDGRIAALQTLGELRNLLRATDQGEPPTRDAAAPSEPQDEITQAQPAAPAPQAFVTAEEQIAWAVPQAVAPPMRYPTWPWSMPVVALRVLFLEAVARPLVWLLAAPRVQSRLRAQEVEEPALLISNHRTAMDVPLLLYGLPFGVRRRVVVAMSGEMLAGWEQSWKRSALPREYAKHRRWWGPIAAWLLRALFGVFPLPRSAGFQRSFLHAGRALDRGFHVLIFPEGHRSSSGEIVAFRQGTGLLWNEAATAVLPLALRIDPAYTQFRFRSHPGVCIGQPLAFARATSIEDQTQQLRAAVQGLFERCDEGAEPAERD